MSVVNGAVANQTTFNNAFVSRTAPTTSTVSKLSLNNAGSTAIDDAQKFTQQLAETVGITENDANRLNYANENYIENGDDHKAAIEKLDAQAKTSQDQLDLLDSLNSQDVTFTAVGAAPNAQGASVGDDQVLTLQPADETNPGVVTALAQDFGGNKTFKGDVVVEGDLTVLGDTFSAQVTNMEVEDQNILVNKGGNDGTAEGAGIEVERTGTHGSLKYDSSLASKWKAGDLGAEGEVVTSGPNQTIDGDKTFNDDISANNLSGTNTGDVTVGAVQATDDAAGFSLDGQELRLHRASDTAPGILSTGAQTIGGDKTFKDRLALVAVDDTTTTGTAAEPALSSKSITRFTDGSLSSIRGFTTPLAGYFGILVNKTGTTVLISHDDGSVANRGILSPTGDDYSWADGESILVFRDDAEQRYRILAIIPPPPAGATNINEYQFNLCGGFAMLTSGENGVDGHRRFPYNAKITNVIMYQEVAGDGGTTEFDVKVKVAGVWTSILSTTPKITNASGDDASVGVGESGTGLTAAVLSTNPYLVNAGTLIRVDLVTAQTGEPNTCGVIVVYEPQ